ncbi:MAG: DUF3137 domain-containing protein [Campylobacter sp.]|nr:DUF3137 domain-containing protein [Campylobacter sp.]
MAKFRSQNNDFSESNLEELEAKRARSAFKMEKLTKKLFITLLVPFTILSFLFLKYVYGDMPEHFADDIQVMFLMVETGIFIHFISNYKMNTFLVFLAVFAFIGFHILLVYVSFNWNYKIFRYCFYSVLIAFFAILIILSFFSKKFFGDYGDWFKVDFRDKMMKKIIKEISPNLVYERNKHIEFKEFLEPMIYNEGYIDNYGGNDLIQGEIDGVKIKFSDVYFKKVILTLDREFIKNETMFKGILFIADFNKFFKSRLVVLDKFDEFAKCQYKKIVMDNIEFNKTFTTHGYNEINARYILTPVLMEKILKLRKTFAKRLNICFLQNKIYIYIYVGRDSFEELDYYKPIIGENSIVEEYKKEIMQFIDIVKDLKLNSKIFKTNLG